VKVLTTDGEAGAQIVSAAGDKDQAALLFRHAKGMIEREPELANRITVFAGAAGTGGQRSMVLKDDPASVYKVVSADADTKHGGNLHMALIDELHVQPNRDLVDTLVTGTASENRAQPLVVYITTADFDRPSICNEIHARACAVRDNGGDPAKPGYDPAFLPVIYEATSEDDWTSEATWRKANPNIGVSVSLEYLRRECKKAQETPTYENTFKRLHLNLKTRSDVRWLSLEQWDKCRGEVSLASLAGRRCHAAFDLSSKKDLTALALWFPPEEEKGVHVLLERLFVPGDTAQQREREDRVPYTTWIREGWVTATEGSMVDQSAMERALMEAAKTYRLVDIAFDMWNSTYLVSRLQEQGANLVQFGQGYRSMSEPTKMLEALIGARRILHRGNPCMRWMVGNAVAKEDEAGNLKPDKEKSADRIDGVVAAVMALGRALVKPEDGSSVYETRGLIQL
jgi:phage terminase large subunit-like protein